MDKIIVYLDDAAFAQQQLAPMKGKRVGLSNPETHWVLVACPPRLTRHAGKWISQSAREAWRAKWAEKLFDESVPSLISHGDRVTRVVANGSLVVLTESLMTEHGAARVMDARRPKFGQDMQPVTTNQPASRSGQWSIPGAMAGMGAVLILAAE